MFIIPGIFSPLFATQHLHTSTACLVSGEEKTKGGGRICGVLTSGESFTNVAFVGEFVCFLLGVDTEHLRMYTLHETNSKTWQKRLKMNGWKMIVSFWGPAYFQVQTVSFREGKSLEILR